VLFRELIDIIIVEKVEYKIADDIFPLKIMRKIRHDSNDLKDEKKCQR